MAALRIRGAGFRTGRIIVKTAALPQSTYSVSFGVGSTRRAEPSSRGRIPRVARLLGVAYTVDGMIRTGELKNMAAAARMLGVTRARMTQIMNLVLLGPPIQEAILGLPLTTTGRDPVSERQLRSIMSEPEWHRQLELWRCLTRAHRR